MLQIKQKKVPNNTILSNVYFLVWMLGTVYTKAHYANLIQVPIYI